MNKRQGEKAYNIRPAFKDKFRPQEAKEKVEKIVKNTLEKTQYDPKRLDEWT